MTPIEKIYNDLRINKSKCSIYFSANTGFNTTYLLFDTGINTGRYMNSGLFPKTGTGSFVPNSGYNFGYAPMRTTLKSNEYAFDSFTVIASTLKTGSGKDIFFGTLESGVNTVNGFNVGVNDANRIFVETHSASGPIIRTSKLVLSDNNLWAVKGTPSATTVYVLDPCTRLLEKESFPSKSDYFWKGTGDKTFNWGRTDYHFNQSKTGDYTFTGSSLTKDFIYHSAALEDSTISRLMLGFETDMVVNSGSYYPGDTGIITGVVNTPVYINKVTGYQVVEGTTGVVYHTFTGDITIYEKTYVNSGVTGSVISGYTSTYLYNTGLENVSTYNTGYVINTGNLMRYRKKSISMVNYPSENPYGLDIKIHAFSLHNSTGIKNNLSLTYSISYGNFTFPKSYSSGQLNIYSNGELLDEGSFLFTDMGYYTTRSVVGGDYVISGKHLITNTGASDSEAIIDYNGINLVFNGTGVTYNGEASSSTNISSTSTVLYDEKSFYDAYNIQFNASGVLGIYNTGFVNNQSVYFINGSRVDKLNFIEHASKVDLISGMKKLILNGEKYQLKY